MTPVTESIYITTIADSLNHWDFLRVILRVTNSPENHVKKNFGINQDLVSNKSYLSNTPLTSLNLIDSYYYGSLYYDPVWIGSIKRPNDPSIIITSVDGNIPGDDRTLMLSCRKLISFSDKFVSG